MLKLDLNSVKIKVDKSKAVPKVETPTGSKSAFCHLTHGANIAGGGFKAAPAVIVVATVELTVDDINDMTGWEFNFLQYTNLMVREAKWGGRTASEGSIYANYAIAPAFPTNPSLDSNSTRDPFFGTNASVQNILDDGPPKKIEITREMGDHPNSKQTLIVPNSATHCDNYLYNMRLDLGLTTVFVARDPQKNFHFLSHFTWHLIYDAKFTWSSGVPTGTMANGRVDVGTITKGKPTDATLQSLLATPKAPYYNDLCKVATDHVANNQTKPCYNESAVRDNTIPANFFT